MFFNREQNNITTEIYEKFNRYLFLFYNLCHGQIVDITRVYFLTKCIIIIWSERVYLPIDLGLPMRRPTYNTTTMIGSITIFYLYQFLLSFWYRHSSSWTDLQSTVNNWAATEWSVRVCRPASRCPDQNPSLTI